MAWVELSFDLERAQLDRASARLFDLGASGLQEDHLGPRPQPRQPWDEGPVPPPPPRLLVRAWFEDPDRASIESHLAALVPSQRLTWSEVEEVDWSESWKQGLGPVRVSERIVVAPPWDAVEGAVVVEPGQGFGTGSHPTTRAALVALDALADSCSEVLDVGCGSGVLALCAARLGLEAEGVDVEEAAITEARRNAVRNGVEAKFSTTPVHLLDRGADLVLANIHAEALVRLAPELLRLTRRHLVLAGVLAEREHLVRAAFDPHLDLDGRDLDGEWVCLRYSVGLGR